MKIVADENIPQVAEAFKELGDVRLIPGRQIEQRHLTDCQCLLVRTVTRVNQELLKSTPVEFVGTATIGTDHIDETYLQQNSIGFSNAAGCNAEAASEYVISGLFALSERKGFNPFKLRAGIIGCGNVGSRLYQKLNVLGIETLRNDPPLAEQGADNKYVGLDTIIDQCNFISLHVPLTREGQHPTEHLFNKARLMELRQGCILVNAARGPVIDNNALLETIEQRCDLTAHLDTWEQEPNLSRELLTKVDLATPHIAGYSVEGRLRGTQMILDAACRHFHKACHWHMSQLLPNSINLAVQKCDDKLKYWQQVFLQHHDIWQDHLALTRSNNLSKEAFARHFDSLRRIYEERFEYERYRISGLPKKLSAVAGELLFKAS
ncbi:MAG: 4-phosphoerythronate dehydrogenase [Gammaproteobacteria bacterium]|nr:4-phosphoerythronate dehydrogenase [Gammaproteobacteria bacterium]